MRRIQQHPNHPIDPFGDVCTACMWDTALCQRCGMIVCGSQTDWVDPVGNICTDCRPAYEAEQAAERQRLAQEIAALPPLPEDPEELKRLLADPNFQHDEARDARFSSDADDRLDERYHQIWGDD